MAAMKPLVSLSSLATLLVMIIALVVLQTQVAESQAQTCSGELSNLNVCAPFVMPGTGANANPSSDCCGALQAVDHDCLCNTIRIASRLPSQCNLPAVTCAPSLPLSISVATQPIEFKENSDAITVRWSQTMTVHLRLNFK
ncbi:unnamed protein product [Ilex paraguariensis]|uniref:Bifunctional inhibitor/plant lipid transfer protein/seed storage helical domain-containing protein n=1 Tax=Ilex paraguariensis TaxID=185542 RepID=A0ABC8QVP3_9AQUA